MVRDVARPRARRFATLELRPARVPGIVDALILAGGKGSRLYPITDYVPKPLIPLRGVPIIEWQIRYLVHHGIRRIIVCAGYRADQLEDFVAARGRLGATVRFSIESSPLGTGGAIRRAEPLVRGGSAIVLNGDVITNIDLARMARAPDSVSAVALRTQYGTLDIDGERVSGFHEKKAIAGMWMNAGVYHLSRRVMRGMPRRGSAEDLAFPKLAARGRLGAVRFPRALWHSVDSHRDLAECEAAIRRIVPYAPRA